MLMVKNGKQETIKYLSHSLVASLPVQNIFTHNYKIFQR